MAASSVAHLLLRTIGQQVSSEHAKFLALEQASNAINDKHERTEMLEMANTQVATAMEHLAEFLAQAADLVRAATATGVADQRLATARVLKLVFEEREVMQLLDYYLPEELASANSGRHGQKETRMALDGPLSAERGDRPERVCECDAALDVVLDLADFVVSDGSLELANLLCQCGEEKQAQHRAEHSCLEDEVVVDSSDDEDLMEGVLDAVPTILPPPCIGDVVAAAWRADNLERVKVIDLSYCHMRLVEASLLPRLLEQFAGCEELELCLSVNSFVEGDESTEQLVDIIDRIAAVIKECKQSAPGLQSVDIGANWLEKTEEGLRKLQHVQRELGEAGVNVFGGWNKKL